MRIIEDANGTIYCSEGELLHCEDGPAIIRLDGYRGYYHHGKLHRVDGPAIVGGKDALNVEVYYLHGKRHRIDGPALIRRDGTHVYYINGVVPTVFNDIIITHDMTDFPSAELDAGFLYYPKPELRAWRIRDPDELTLAILKYG